jgi:hypothetical protein
MVGGVMLGVMRGRTRAVQEAIQSWPGGTVESGRLLDVQDAVRECLELPPALRNLWNTTFDRMTANQLSLQDLLDLRDPLESLFDEALQTVVATQERVHELEQAGCRIELAAGLEAAAAELRRLKHFIFEHWPRWDAAAVEEALAEVERGEYKTVEEILRELQDKDA